MHRIPIQQIFGFWIKQQSKHIWFAPHQNLVEGISLKPMKWRSLSMCILPGLPLWWSPPKKADLKQIFHLGGFSLHFSVNESFSKRQHKDKLLFHDAILSFELGTRTRKTNPNQNITKKTVKLGHWVGSTSAWPPPQQKLQHRAAPEGRGQQPGQEDKEQQPTTQATNQPTQPTNQASNKNYNRISSSVSTTNSITFALAGNLVIWNHNTKKKKSNC